MKKKWNNKHLHQKAKKKSAGPFFNVRVIAYD
jgi:hypothetical protein